MLESIDLVTLLLIILVVAAIAAVINFIIGVVLTLKMASLRGLTKEKKPAIILNAIWSLIVLLTGFSPWTYIFAFLINLIIGMIALQNDKFYGLKEFRKRLTFLLIIFIVQFIILIIVYIVIFFLIVVFILGL